MQSKCAMPQKACKTYNNLSRPHQLKIMYAIKTIWSYIRTVYSCARVELTHSECGREKEKKPQKTNHNGAKAIFGRFKTIFTNSKSAEDFFFPVVRNKFMNVFALCYQHRISRNDTKQNQTEIEQRKKEYILENSYVLPTTKSCKIRSTSHSLPTSWLLWLLWVFTIAIKSATTTGRKKKKKETTNETGVSRSQTPRTHPTIRGASSFTSTPELVLRLAAVTIPFILFSHILFLFGFLLEKYCRTVCCDYTKQLVEHAIISDDFHESAAFCMAHRCWWKTMTWPEKNAGKSTE